MTANLTGKRFSRSQLLRLASGPVSEVLRIFGNRAYLGAYRPAVRDDAWDWQYGVFAAQRGDDPTGSEAFRQGFEAFEAAS